MCSTGPKPWVPSPAPNHPQNTWKVEPIRKLWDSIITPPEQPSSVSCMPHNGLQDCLCSGVSLGCLAHGDSPPLSFLWVGFNWVDTASQTWKYTGVTWGLVKTRILTQHIGSSPRTCFCNKCVGDTSVRHMLRGWVDYLIILVSAFCFL